MRTTRLRLSWIDQNAALLGVGIAVATIMLAALIASVGRIQAPVAAAQPAQPPIILVATATAQAARVITVERVLVVTPTAAPQPTPAPAQPAIVYAAELEPTAAPVATAGPLVQEIATAVAAQPGATVQVVSDRLQDSGDPVVQASYAIFGSPTPRR